MGLKSDLSSLNMAVLMKAVHIPFFTQFIHDGKLVPNEIIEKSADAMLDELVRWAKGDDN